MSKVNDGGPAFPVAETHEIASELPWTQGMTLRDWFAGQALVGIYADSDRQWTPKLRAEIAYAAADAMLAEREKRGGGA